MSLRLRPALALAAAACVLISAAGCGGGTSAADGRASATAARNQALAALRGLYQHIHAASWAPLAAAGGLYARCVTNQMKPERTVL